MTIFLWRYVYQFYLLFSSYTESTGTLCNLGLSSKSHENESLSDLASFPGWERGYNDLDPRHWPAHHIASWSSWQIYLLPSRNASLVISANLQEDVRVCRLFHRSCYGTSKSRCSKNRPCDRRKCNMDKTWKCKPPVFTVSQGTYESARLWKPVITWINAYVHKGHKVQLITYFIFTHSTNQKTN